MRRIVGIAFVLLAVLTLTGACATKNWVREQLGVKEAEMGQRLDQAQDRVDTRFKTVEGQVDTRFGQVDHRVKTVETSVGEAGETAKGARERSETAFAKAGSVDSRLTRLWTNRYNMKVADVVEIPFGFDRADLGDSAQTTLVRIAKELQENPGLAVELAGYTDSKGAREYNYQLSQRRVDSVRRFLVERGVSLYRIQAVGLGPIADPAMPQDKKRRVSLKLLVDQE